MSKIVLCVDDSATMQMVADITFRGTEFQYVGARTYDEAVQKAKSQKPAVVLADATLPNKSGYDLCLALKQDGGMGDVPFVILVGNSAPYDTAKGTQVGADANLPKPWDTQTMLEKITEIVSKGSVAKPGQAGAAAAPAAKPAPAPAPAPAAAAAAAAAAGAPRSATMMGMPTIRMPAGVAPTVTPAPMKAPAAPAAAATVPGPAPAKAPAAPAPAPAAAAPAAVAPSAGHGIGGMNRPPMVAGSATKRSALVERTLAKMAAKLAEQAGLEPGSPELAALLKLSAEVVERIVWEIVPDLAEQIIRENLDHLAAQKRS